MSGKTVSMLAVFLFAPLIQAQEIGFDKLAADVLTKEQRAEAKSALDRAIQQQTAAFNAKHREDWYQIKTLDQWEKYRDERIARLRKSLGEFPAPGKPNVRITGVFKGDGYNLENVLYETRPGQWVPGNLYVPSQPGKSMPGILIAHAHHRGKSQSEMQDMGMTWARAGCMVLVIDQVGYGERRPHPFHRDADYAKPYKTSRQDYYFRYDTGVQLQLLGDSLMGWMAWDLMRGVDLLLARDGIDAKRIILLGAVAGGGDPAGVTAALDPRITCVVPFNFGGPQPETRYPLPEDAETSFNYLLFTYWDSTRGLRLGARDDFPHWVITASVAPRYLIHSHEFSWDGERDPVWKRYQKVWGLYKAQDHVGVAHGKGLLKGRPPEASHCTNIGEFHRRMIHPLFDKWFGIKATEFSAQRPSEDLLCVTEKARKDLDLKSLNRVMSEIGQARIDKARARLAGKSLGERRTLLRAEWSKLLGPVTPTKPVVKSATKDADPVGGGRVERVVLEVEPGIVVPLIVLTPMQANKASPVVIGLAQGGKAGFLKERSAEIANLVKSDHIVVLPDMRGTGETRSSGSRGRDSGDTNYSTHVQLFGETSLGQRLRDLRGVLAYVRSRGDVDGKKIGLWGDSFAPTNGPNTDFKVPHAVDGQPTPSEPLGGLLGLLGGLFEDDIRAVHISGGLVSYHPVLAHFAVLIPHDASVPGALTAGDLSDLAGSLGAPIRLSNMVDHLNRRVPTKDLLKAYQAARQGNDQLSFSEGPSTATWLAEQFR